MKCKVCNEEFQLGDHITVHMIEEHIKEFLLTLFYVGIEDSSIRRKILDELCDFSEEDNGS